MATKLLYLYDFVEYKASPETVVDDKLKDDLQENINNLLQSTYTNKIMFLPPAEMTRYCRHVPDKLKKGLLKVSYAVSGIN